MDSYIIAVLLYRVHGYIESMDRSMVTGIDMTSVSGRQTEQPLPHARAVPVG